MLILFSLQLISVYLVQSLEQYYLRNYKDSLENQARLLSAFVEPDPGTGMGWLEDTESLARGFRELQGMEIVILDSHAHIIGTSDSQALIGSRLIRDEITRALAGHVSENIRFDPVNQERRYYLAFPIVSGQSTLGVIYLSGSLRLVDNTLSEVKTILLTGVGLALAVSFVLGLVLTGTITRPIKEVTNQAHYMARGDFSRKINVKTADEIGRLGNTFNYLADRLSHTINEISSEKSKVEAIINNMSDGVVALDGKGRLIQINPSARRLIEKLKLKAPQLNRSGFNLLRRLIGSDTLRQFIRQQKPLSAEISDKLFSYTVQIKLAPFKIEEGRLDGTLMVLHDITKDRELTKRQEEFVADVSHELRTPLTTVKSYVETLLDGAAEEPDVRTRFLNILEKETDRMVTMVKDLLILSQIDSSQLNWLKTEVELLDLVLEVIDQARHKIDLKLPNIEVDLPDDIPVVYVDHDKMMQILNNLLNNAIKYTAPDGVIKISASEEDSSVKVFIEDNGCGIPESDLAHVFERFYRVEKTRSRDFGGTGLGLSIARKLIEAQGGMIWIESTVGIGTKVCFTVPRTPDSEVRVT